MAVMVTQQFDPSSAYTFHEECKEKGNRIFYNRSTADAS